MACKTRPPAPGCPTCAADLIASHLDMLRRVAVNLRRKCASNHNALPLAFDDLIQEGYFGLAAAARKHDPDKGPFTPFAIKLVTYAMLDAIERAERGPLLRGYDPGILDSFDVSQQGRPQNEPEGYTVPDEGGVSRRRGRWRPAVPGQESNPFESLEVADHVSVLLRHLPRRLRRVIVLRWGLGGGRPRSNREVGKIMGVSRQRVHQLYSRAFSLVQAVAGNVSPHPEKAVRS